MNAQIIKQKRITGTINIIKRKDEQSLINETKMEETLTNILDLITNLNDRMTTQQQMIKVLRDEIEMLKKKG